MAETNSVPDIGRGVARIKPEYIVLNQSREVNVNFISEKDKRSIDPDDSDTSGPPKKKLKGQNKHRPHNKRTPKCDKLCFTFSSTGTCPYNEKCIYSHDVKSYMQMKPADIGENCYLFDTFGKCPYSLSCRFGNKHISDCKNIVKEDIITKFKDETLVSNVLSKDVQHSLRRRTYDFSKSLAALKEINVQDSGKKRSREANAETSGSDEKQVVTGVEKGTENQKICNTDQENQLNNSANPEQIVDVKSSDLQCSKENDVKKLAIDQTNQSSTMCSDLTNDLSIDKDEIRIRPSEIKKIDFKDKLFLAPLTTVGNLPFRRICKEFGADITCGEMAMATSLLQGSMSEWALLKRHHTEDIFGVQLCGGYPDTMTKCCQLLTENISVDFIDLNLGCPLDAVCQKGCGCGLMNRSKKLDEIMFGVSSVVDVPITVKMRTGININEPIAHNVIKRLLKWKDSIGMITVHGRSRVQRYTKSADWDYIDECSKAAYPIPVFGGGDVFSYEDYILHRKETSVSGIMLARGALIKPWISKEIKEQTHWDISSGERFDILKSYTNYGLEHWGSDTEGVEKTRRFLLEWLSFLYRYIPVGLLEVLPQRINERPPPYCGRNDLETLMASPSCADWVKISEMLLGPVPENFTFLPKHKANAYQ